MLGFENGDLIVDIEFCNNKNNCAICKILNFQMFQLLKIVSKRLLIF